MRIVDRDWVELSNLQRQALFVEADAIQSTPKAMAAAAAIERINSEVSVEPLVEDIDFRNMASLAEGCDLILDGTDNFETRFLINDYCVKHGVPWIHGGCLGASGQVLSIVPGKTACFRCLVPELPPREVLETCDSAGVLGPAIGMIASWQSSEALKILTGNAALICQGLLVVDCWNSDCRIVKLRPAKNCVACAEGSFPFLHGDIRTEVKVLCGKNAVQIESPMGQHQALEELAAGLGTLGEVTHNAFFVRLKLPEHTLTIFRGGRTVVEGTQSESEAKTILARSLGS